MNFVIAVLAFAILGFLGRLGMVLLTSKTMVLGSAMPILGAVGLHYGLSGGVLVAIMVLLLPFMMGAALTAGKQTPILGLEGAKKRSFPMKAAAKVFKGGFVCVDATGFAVAGADTAGLVCVGVAEESIDNTSGANGALTVTVLYDCEADVVGSGLSQANAGAGTSVELGDDQTVLAPAAGVNHIKVGPIVEFRSATDATVYVIGLSGAKP